MEDRERFATAYDRFLDLIRDRYPEWHRGINLLSNRLVELVIVGALAVGVQIVFLYCSRIFWAIYVETPVGHVYMAGHPETTAIIGRLLAHDLCALALGCAWSVLRNLALVGAVCQMSLVLRCLYFSQGLFGRVLFWGLPLAALTAFQSQAALQTDFPLAMLLTVVPTLILMPHCFQLIANYVPEIDDLYRILVSKGLRGLREYWRRGRPATVGEVSGDICPSQPGAVILLKDDPSRPGVSEALCGGCRQKMVYPSKFAGRKVTCRGCESVFVLPGAT